MSTSNSKPNCDHYKSWKDAPEPLQSEECWFLDQEPHGYRQFCDMGQCKNFEQVCPEAWRWGHE